MATTQEYMAALEKASVKEEIGVFVRFVGKMMEH